MQYLLLAIADEIRWRSLPDEERQRGVARFGAYVQDLKAAEALVGAYRPHPSADTTTVHLVDGTPQIGHGPHSGGSEQVTGVYVIDVPDAEAAREWAERNPAAAFGVVEIRPVWAAPTPVGAGSAERGERG